MSDIQEHEDTPLHLLVVLARAYNAVMTHSHRGINSHGLNSTEFGVLDVLYHKGPRPAQKLAKRCSFPVVTLHTWWTSFKRKPAGSPGFR